MSQTKEEKLAHLFSSGKLYLKGHEISVELSDDRDYVVGGNLAYLIAEWLKNINLDEWTTEKTKPKKTTLYRHWYKEKKDQEPDYILTIQTWENYDGYNEFIHIKTTILDEVECWT